MTILRLTALALLLGVATPAVLAQAATQDVTIVVEEVNEISVSGAVTLTINSVTPGQGPDDATDSSTTYALTTNGSNKKITAQLGMDYASGIALSVSLAAPAAGGTSAGNKALSSATAVDLVTGLSGIAESGIGIAYTASATGAAAPNAATGETQTVTFTVTNV